MSNCRMVVWWLVAMLLFFSPGLAASEGSKVVQLPRAQTTGGRPLLSVLQERKSTREYAPDKISLSIISNLLWAAFGINRPESGCRTAPSACNCQEIDIFVAVEDGLYLYDPKAHALKLILAEDIRTRTGFDFQMFVKNVPLNLIYVADMSRMARMEKDFSAEERAFYCAIDTGYISQNVYLYCASEGLATVARGLVDRSALAQAMKLRPDQKVMLCQSVGYPKK